jgi:hypothetical protein
MRITVGHLIIVASVVAAVIVAAFAVQVASHRLDQRDAMGCEANVYSLAIAMEMYAADYDERYPPADRWVDLTLQDFVKTPGSYRCPRDRSTARSSYGMNSAISGMQMMSVPDDVVCLYETAHPGDNPYGSPDDMPLPPRHLGGNLTCRRWPNIKQDHATPTWGPFGPR